MFRRSMVLRRVVALGGTRYQPILSTKLQHPVKQTIVTRQFWQDSQKSSLWGSKVANTAVAVAGGIMGIGVVIFASSSKCI